MKKLFYPILLLVILSATENLLAQSTVPASPVLIYEIPYKMNGKPDTVMPDISAISEEYRFYCTRSSVMYVEVTTEQATLFEKVMNELHIPCQPKHNCTLSQVRDQCITEAVE